MSEQAGEESKGAGGRDGCVERVRAALTSARGGGFTRWALGTAGEDFLTPLPCSWPSLTWCSWITRNKAASGREWFGFAGHSVQSLSVEGFGEGMAREGPTNTFSESLVLLTGEEGACSCWRSIS